MILVDTSVWIDHFCNGEPNLVELLGTTQVVIHPFVIGEIACGNLRQRGEILGLLNRLPQAPVASQDEALYFLENYQLMGKGVGFIDVHLLASTRLMNAALIWTRDKQLQSMAAQLDLSAAY